MKKFLSDCREGLAGSMQSSFDSSFCGVEDFGSFASGVLENIAEQEHCLLQWRQMLL
ncbi:hypothetical protein D3C76_1660860 [compost metagenome]